MVSMNYGKINLPSNPGERSIILRRLDEESLDESSTSSMIIYCMTGLAKVAAAPIVRKFEIFIFSRFTLKLELDDINRGSGP